ncbi:MAG: hypothetical protein B7Z55_06570 [Planctomycetales bacterium 12-60-4]|nr:MAG: hypothetical protein B7Z55_06570 [Planctomycetales bacterium 12-60-4]
MTSTTDISAPSETRHDLSTAERSFAIVREDLSAAVQGFLARQGGSLVGAEVPLDEAASSLTQALLVLMRAYNREPHWQRYLEVLSEQIRSCGLSRATVAQAAEQWLDYLPEHYGADVWTAGDRLTWADLLTQLLQSLDASHAFAGPAADVGDTDQPTLKTPSSDSARAMNTIVPFPQPVDGSCPTHGQDLSPLLESQTMSLETTVPSETSAGQSHAAVENFYGLIENAPIAALHVDPRGQITYLNRAGQELFDHLSEELGYGAEQLVGGPASRLHSALPALKKLGGLTTPQIVTVGEVRLEISAQGIASDSGSRRCPRRSFSPIPR